MTYLTILILILLILCSAFLSGTETSLFSLSSLQLKTYIKSDNRRLQLIAHLMRRARDVLVTILMLNVLCNILVQNAVSNLFEQSENWVLKVVLPLCLTLIFGELLPKSIALPNNAKIAYFSSPIIENVANFLSPLRKVLNAITGALARMIFLLIKEEEEISNNELKHVLKTSEAKGIILKDEQQLMAGVLELEQDKVLEHMRPRDEIVFYDIKEPISKLFSLFTDQQITRLPVCDGGIENLKGIISVRSFFFSDVEVKEGKDVLPLLKKPYFVPETMKAATLLRVLREKGLSIAIAVDEYGSITGLVTQEDLIEQVVGEISDLRDTKNLYTRSENNVIIASGKLELSEFEELFQVYMPQKEKVVTLGGWLIQQMGTIPQTGTKFATDDFLFYILSSEPNRVKRVYVRKLRKDD
jgi:putative hemolysin